MLIRNYIIGSSLAVLGVGTIGIFFTLNISLDESFRLAAVLIISLSTMFTMEFFVFRKHVEPIKALFRTPHPALEDIERAYLQTHRFPTLAVKRIFGPHMLGLSIPLLIMMYTLVRWGYLSFPMSYVGTVAVCAVLVASMHALIEFFLTSVAIRPVLLHIRELGAQYYEADISLGGKVLVSIQRKFQLSAFLIGTFPLFLFSLANQIRLNDMSAEQFAGYWQWAGLILILGIGFASLGAWLLSRDVQQPIRNLYEAMGKVQEGSFQVHAADIYSDEFSRLAAGFNHMVKGLSEREKMNNQLIASYFATLAAALDARDPYTAGHSDRVANYSVQIGSLAGLPPKEVDLLKKTALLHDIGKIGVRDDVLLKDGKLTDEEFAQIKLHPVLGERILKQIEPANAMAPYLPGVRSHHERFDGRGYPDGLAGYDIPLFGRIIAVADAFDAMTSDRPYRKGMSFDRALSILNEGKGTQWDPEFAQLFINSFAGKDKLSS
jgi:HD-GYP domain-containing protein (c-di-GMP phosphodiesterase class II)